MEPQIRYATTSDGVNIAYAVLGGGTPLVSVGAVNIASRISGLSAPGEVLVSDTVRSLARTSAGVTFEDRGEHALKGVGEPVRVYEVRRRE